VRKAILFLAVLGLAGSLWAADPIIGTWKLNIEKSKGSQPAQSSASQPAADPIKEQIEVYRELDSGQIELTLTRTMADGTSSASRLTWPTLGGAVTFLRGEPRGRTLVETLIAPGEWYVTYMRDGKQYLIVHKAVSKDGRTLLQTFKGLAGFASGQFVDSTRLFDKQ
jgi:hypothetical protein